MGFRVLITLSVFFAYSVSLNIAVADEQKEQARIQFEQGKTFFNQGEYTKAAIALERAYELRPGYRILYYLGLAENENGNYRRALEAYNRYIEEGETEDSPQTVQEVKNEIARLGTLVGTIKITCAIERAKVQIDNESRGITPLEGPLYVDIGQHEILVKIGQKELLREVIRIAGGQHLTLAVEAPANPQQAEPPASPIQNVQTKQDTSEIEQATVKSQKPKRLWTWIAFGIGGAALASAAVTGSLALKLDDDMWSRCPDGKCHSANYDGDFGKDYDNLKALGLTTDILFGVAGAGIVAGVLLYFFESKKSKKESLHAYPTVYRDGAFLSLEGRF